MYESARLDLLALVEALDKISLYTQDADGGDDLYHDQKSFDAAMMQFVVIGEIIIRLDKDFKESSPQIPWQKIKDFRNVIAHDYFGIDADEIWDIINNRLIPLKSEIKALLTTL